MSAKPNVTFPKAAQFFRAFSSIFCEKSVAVRRAHFGAITALRRPVPQAHSSTSSSGPIRPAVMRFSSRWAFRLMTRTNTPYTPATRSQNMCIPSRGML